MSWTCTVCGHEHGMHDCEALVLDRPYAVVRGDPDAERVDESEIRLGVVYDLVAVARVCGCTDGV